MSHEEMREVAEAAADAAVARAFMLLGFDASDAKEVREMQADFLHLRNWRKSTEAVKRKALLTAVGVIVTGAIGYLLVAFKWPTGGH